jgi:two-component system, response regulator PdtaR
MPLKNNRDEDDMTSATLEQPALIDHPEHLPERPERILIAEDEHLVATDIKLMLTDLGYAPVVVSDGEEAVNAARELYMSLGVPVVIVSAFADREQVSRAQEAGVFGYLIKPVQRDQLRVTIDIAWRRFVMDATERHESHKLRKRLEERKVVEQAKWTLVSTRGMTEPDAMRHLQKQARSTRRPLIDVASEVIRSHPTT